MSYTLFNVPIYNEFPSPIGVLYISIKHKMKHKIAYILVSVPYWGSLYFNIQSFTRVREHIPSVSVPYWGSLYFNAIEFYYSTYISILFPSPIGVLYISIQRRKFKRMFYCVSVPYWGSLYFNSTALREAITLMLFPSPIGVLYISIQQYSY